MGTRVLRRRAGRQHVPSSLLCWPWRCAADRRHRVTPHSCAAENSQRSHSQRRPCSPLLPESPVGLLRGRSYQARSWLPLPCSTSCGPVRWPANSVTAPSGRSGRRFPTSSRSHAVRATRAATTTDLSSGLLVPAVAVAFVTAWLWDHLDHGTSPRCLARWALLSVVAQDYKSARRCWRTRSCSRYANLSNAAAVWLYCRRKTATGSHRNVDI